MIELSLTLCEEVAYAGRRVVLFRDVEWPSVPPEGATLTFGKTSEGESPGTTARVRSVYFAADGSVHVEAEADRLHGEYDDVVAYARRDGFRTYEERSAA